MVPHAVEHVTHPRVATRKLPVILILAAQDQTQAVERRVLERHQRATLQHVVLVVAVLVVAVIMPVKHAGIN